jgi:hypothetical protein
MLSDPTNRFNPFLLRLSWSPAGVDRRGFALLLSFIVGELWYGCFLLPRLFCLSEKDRTLRKPESS